MPYRLTMDRETVACHVDLVRRGAFVMASQNFSMNGIMSLSREKNKRWADGCSLR